MAHASVAAYNRKSGSNRLTFSNNEELHEFVITIARDVNTNSDTLSSDLDTKRIDLDTNSDTLPLDLDTKRQNLDTDSDTLLPDLDTKQHFKLNNGQKDVVNYCTIPRSSREILERIGVTNHTKNREKYINVLVDAGYLEMTNPDNPNASNQKYRKKTKNL